MSDTQVTMVIVAGIALLVLLRVCSSFAFARSRAIRHRLKEVDLMFGWVKLVLWEPNEGLIVLRNKQVTLVVQHPSGGTRFIYPIRGEELGPRVPLMTRFVTWEDDNVLTRESLQVRVKVGVWWRVTELRPFVYNIDHAAHAGSDMFVVGVVESAERWLKTIAESIIRVLASQASIAQMVSSIPTRYLTAAHHEDGDGVHRAPPDVAATISQTIGTGLRSELEAKVKDWGLKIDSVEVQEVRLSPQVQQAIDNVWLAFLKPVQSEQEGKARRIELEAAAAVLGADAVALIETLKVVKETDLISTPSFMVPPLLQTILQPVERRAAGLQRGLQGSPQLTAAQPPPSPSEVPDAR